MKYSSSVIRSHFVRYDQGILTMEILADKRFVRRFEPIWHVAAIENRIKSLVVIFSIPTVSRSEWNFKVTAITAVHKTIMEIEQIQTIPLNGK